MTSAAVIISAVRNSFGDLAGAQLTDALILAWINQGQKDILTAQPEIYYKVANGTVDSVTNITLPTDLVILKDLRLGLPAKNKRLARVEFEQVESTFGDFDSFPVAEPTHYWEFGGKVNLYPTPNQPYALNVYYVRSPVDVTTSTSVVDVPVLYENRLIEYCLAQAAKSDDNLDRAAFETQQYEKGMDRVKDRDDTEQTVYPSMTYINEYTDAVDPYYYP